jgi:hypothetical protein
MMTIFHAVGGGDLLAYIGPGAGLSMLGALVAVACVLLLALIAPILYPIRLLRAWLRRRRERRAAFESSRQDEGVLAEATAPRGTSV